MVMQTFFKKGLNSHIVIDKLGITFRPLTMEEKDNEILMFDNYFFNGRSKNRIKRHIERKNITNDLLKTYAYMKKHKKTEETDEEIYADIVYSDLEKVNKVFNKSYIKKQLKKIVIVEISDVLNDFVSDNLKAFIVSRILKTLLYSMEGNDYNTINNLSIYSDVNTILQDDFGSKILFTINYSESVESFFDEVDLNEQHLNKLNLFLNKLSKERIRDFLLVVDSLFSNNLSSDNKILNFMSILERILVKYDKDINYDVGKQLFLKFGMCIHDCKKEVSNFDLKDIKYCYDVRSCIIHGNDIELLNAPKRYLKLENSDLKKMIKSEKNHDIKHLIVFLAVSYLQSNLNFILKEWVNDTIKVEFFKQN